MKRKSWFALFGAIALVVIAVALFGPPHLDALSSLWAIPIGVGMAKEAGYPLTLTVDEAVAANSDIANDVTSIRMSTPRGMVEVTGLDKSAVERLLLRADGHVELKGVFNDAANKSHDVFKTVPTTSVSRTVVIGVSGQTLTMEMLFSNYELEMGEDGHLVWTATGDLCNGTAPAWT